MPLSLHDLKELHDKAYTYGQINRERAADDLIFYYITQWDDDSLSDSQLAYRGEFNIIRKAGRQILADLEENQVQIDFDPKDQTRDDGAELLDGLYRTDDNNNLSIESYEVANNETVVCGVGAWELYTEYDSLKSPDRNQSIRRRPLYEANNNGFWDPNAKRIDKSDAMYHSYLTPYTEDGYKTLVEDLTGEKIKDVSIENFKYPEHSYTFPWIGGEGKKIYVTTFYHRELVKDKILTMVDPFGETKGLKESSLSDVMDEMLDDGYSIESEKEIQRWEVRKYIASGEKILNGEEDGEDGERTGEIIAGENIPVVPQYGERAYVEGEEHYEGVVRLAKDPQRLRNFQLSYLADIVSTSPRDKPVYWPEQIAGFKDMYEINGADNNYPYLLMNRKGDDGVDLPVGPTTVIPSQPVPQALAASIELTRQAVEDVAPNPGIISDMADTDISGKAVQKMTARLEIQSVHYQTHRKYAKRRDAEIYASMASEIHDVPRNVKVTLPDGTTKDVEVMEAVFDKETGEYTVLNDIFNAEFDVTSKIGPSYTSQKEQTIERLENQQQYVLPGDPMQKILMLKSLELMDGVNYDDIREYSTNQLILMGVKKPDTPEQEQMLLESQQQPEEPTADMALAQAEMVKGQAQQMEAQIKQIQTQLNAQNESMKRQIDMFKAETDRMDTQIDAQEAGAKIDNTSSDTVGKDLENAAKIIELQAPKPLGDMSDDELFEQVRSG